MATSTTTQDQSSAPTLKEARAPGWVTLLVTILLIICGAFAGAFCTVVVLVRYDPTEIWPELAQDNLWATNTSLIALVIGVMAALIGAVGAAAGSYFVSKRIGVLLFNMAQQGAAATEEDRKKFSLNLQESQQAYEQNLAARQEFSRNFQEAGKEFEDLAIQFGREANRGFILASSVLNDSGLVNGQLNEDQRIRVERALEHLSASGDLVQRAKIRLFAPVRFLSRFPAAKERVDPQATQTRADEMGSKLAGSLRLNTKFYKECRQFQKRLAESISVKLPGDDSGKTGDRKLDELEEEGSGSELETESGSEVVPKLVKSEVGYPNATTGTVNLNFATQVTSGAGDQKSVEDELTDLFNVHREIRRVYLEWSTFLKELAVMALTVSVGDEDVASVVVKCTQNRLVTFADGLNENI